MVCLLLKMKWRLKASISPLLTGWGKRSISDLPKLHFSNGSDNGFKYSKWGLGISRLETSDKFSVKTTTGKISSLFSRCEVQGYHSLKRSLHSSSCEEDDFSELGPPVAQGDGIRSRASRLLTEKPGASFIHLQREKRILKRSGRSRKLKVAWHGKRSLLKTLRSANGSSGADNACSELGLTVPEEGSACSILSTETPNPSLDTDPVKRLVDGASQSAKKKSKKSSSLKKSKKSSSLKKSNHKGLPCDAGNDNGVSTSKSISETTRKDKRSRTIRIENIPNTINIYLLRNVVSVFGEISSCYMRKDSNGSYQSCHVEFKSTESKERAITTKGITVKNVHLPIHDLHFENHITVRINNINENTTENFVYSICKTYGTVEGLKLTNKGVVDVFFNVKDTSTRHEIMKKLNDTSIDGCRWSAKLIQSTNTTTKTTFTADADNDDVEADSPFTTMISDIRNELDMKNIYLSDLENLHHSLVHLRDGTDC